MLDTREFFCYCDLPALPSSLALEVNDIATEALEKGKNIQFSPFLHRLTTNEVNDIAIKRLTLDEGRSIVRYRRTFLSSNVIKWFEENVTSDYSEIGIQTMDQGEIMIPHTDGGKRIYILNYLIDAGGINVTTKWHQEVERNIIRPTQRALQYISQTNLTTIHEERILPNTWSMLYGKVIHSVNNITGRRMNISIAFSPEEFNNFKQRYNVAMPIHL